MVRLTDEAAAGRPGIAPPHRLAAIALRADAAHDPLLRALADHPRIDLTVRAVGRAAPWRAANAGLVRAVLRGDHDAILVERYAHATTLLAWLAARASRTAIFLRLGPDTAPRRWAVTRWLQRLLRRSFLQRTDGVLAIGTRHGWLHEHQDVPAERMFHTPAGVEACVGGVVDALDCVERRRVSWRHEEPRWIAEQDGRPSWVAMGKSEGNA
jgi:hypothetical protein